MTPSNNLEKKTLSDTEGKTGKEIPESSRLELLKKSSTNNFALSEAEDHPNHHNNSHELCNENGHPLLSLLESQLKLRQQHDQDFSMEGKPL